MRKNFLMMMATAICALVITSCVKGPDDIPPSPTPTPTPTPTPEEKFDAAFVKYVEKPISSNQDWGFGLSKVAGARGLTRGSEKGYYISDNYPKQYTQEFFKQALDSLKQGQKVGESIKNFEFISRGPFRFDFVFSYTYQQNLEIGYYYYNPCSETAASAKTVQLTADFDADLAKRNYFQFTTSTASTPPEESWKTCPEGAGYQIWTVDNATRVRAHMFTLRDGSDDTEVTVSDVVDVPRGYRVGFYAKYKSGETRFTNRYKNKNEENMYFAVLDSKDAALKNTYLVGIEDCDPSEKDFDCNDIMIAVHKNVEKTFPLLVIPSPYYRIIGEDLTVGTDYNADFDFNDVVLDVKITDKGADCILQAAGGQLPIRINGQNDLEIHQKFGVDLKTMVNTNADKIGQPSATKDPVEFSITGKFSSADDVLIEVNKGTTDKPDWRPLYAKKGETACKILVNTNFEWPDERQSLKVKYPKFVDWVNDPTVIWYP